MFKYSKISLNKKTCVSSKISIPIPVLTIEPPSCPFNFYAESTPYVPPEGVIHISTIWELASDIAFTNKVKTVETKEDKHSVIFPCHLLKENTTYYLRACFITNKGESSFSEIATIQSKYNSVSRIENTDQTFNYKNDSCNGNLYAFYNNTNQKIIKLRHNPDEMNIQLYYLNGGVWELKNNYGSGNITGCGSYDIGDINTHLKGPFVFCDNGIDTVYASVLTYNTQATPNWSMILLKINLTDMTISLLPNSINNPIYNREQCGLCFHNNEIYFVGGWRFNENGIYMQPTVDEYSIFKYNLTTETFTNIEITQEIKPWCYRKMSCIKVDNGMYIYGGTDKYKIINGDKQYLGYFDFTNSLYTFKGLKKNTYLPIKEDASNIMINTEGIYVIHKDEKDNALILMNFIPDFLYTYWKATQEKYYIDTEKWEFQFSYNFLLNSTIIDTINSICVTRDDIYFDVEVAEVSENV